MKLLKLEIGDIPSEKRFRSLQSGFVIEFHRIDAKGLMAMSKFNPFCFAGLNGSGKSNVLEAISSIFFHLECCVAKYRPKGFERNFLRTECSPDAFTLEYLIGQRNSVSYTPTNFDKITVTKKAGKAPTMTRQAYPFSAEEEIMPVSLKPRYDTTFPQAAEGKDYLPDIIVGYSSGENEILSLPFFKSRLINFDKYREDYIREYRFEEPENSLIYVDSNMSQAVLLACLLYESDETVKLLKDQLGIIGIKSFTMNLNVHKLSTKRNESARVTDHIIETIDKLKNISTTWQEFKQEDGQNNGDLPPNIRLDFFVDDQTKIAFKHYFATAFDLFRFLQVLYELNANSVPEFIRDDIYKSKGVHTDTKLPQPAPDENVFFFLDYLVLKETVSPAIPKPLLLRELSDGEHQFLHTVGICLMLRNRRSILLLDEPETHFNPTWRSKFIQLLELGIESNSMGSSPDFNIHYLKDILLTSHSPFIISDCLPEHVIFFERDKELNTMVAKSAAELGLNTYGSSVDYILKNFYKTSLISSKSLEELKNLIDNGSLDELRKGIDNFGESSEKQFLFKKIYEKTNDRK